MYFKSISIINLFDKKAQLFFLISIKYELNSDTKPPKIHILKKKLNYVTEKICKIGLLIIKKCDLQSIVILFLKASCRIWIRQNTAKKVPSSLQSFDNISPKFQNSIIRSVIHHFPHRTFRFYCLFRRILSKISNKKASWDTESKNTITSILW